jgi:hypothetical protein
MAQQSHCLHGHPAQVLATVTQCVVAFAAALEAEGHAKQDVQLRLPLSGLLHRPQPSITASQAAGAVEAALQHQHSQQPQSQLPSLGSLLLGSKQPLAVPSVAASPFAALTGRGDTYASVQELVYSCKPHIHLDSASIPVSCEFSEGTTHCLGGARRCSRCCASWRGTVNDEQHMCWQWYSYLQCHTSATPPRHHRSLLHSTCCCLRCLS